MDDVGRILDAIGEIKTEVQGTRSDIQNIMIKNAEQELKIEANKERIGELRSSVGNCFGKIEKHEKNHPQCEPVESKKNGSWKPFAAVTATVGAIIGIAKGLGVF